MLNLQKGTSHKWKLEESSLTFYKSLNSVTISNPSQLSSYLGLILPFHGH